jgi:hypothetical protein
MSTQTAKGKPKRPDHTHLPWYVGQLQNAEQQLEEAFLFVGDKHQRDPEILHTSRLLASWSRTHIELLERLGQQVGGQHTTPDPERLRAALFHGNRFGGLGLVRDLHDLSILVTDVQVGWTILRQAAAGLHDMETEAECIEAFKETARQLDWVKTQIKQASSQALTVPADPRDEVPASMPKPPNAPALPEALFGPLAGGGAVLLVGVVGLLTGRPLLFPALGPTAYLQATSPANPEARFYNTVVGHTIGLLAGFAGVLLVGAMDAPVVLQTRELVAERVWAAVIAVSLTLLLAPLVRASHPPAGATTLLVALGSFSTLADALNVLLGTLIVAAVGELVRRWRLRKAPFKSRSAPSDGTQPAPRMLPSPRP